MSSKEAVQDEDLPRDYGYEGREGDVQGDETTGPVTTNPGRDTTNSPPSRGERVYDGLNSGPESRTWSPHPKF